MASEIDFGKRLGMGCLRLPRTDDHDENDVDYETTKKNIDDFMAAGFNYFDTSYIYHGGNAERALGDLLVDRYPRDSFMISTKMPINFMSKPEDMERIFQEQLDRCHLDYFDFYLLHDIKRPSYEKSKRWGAWEFLAQKQKEGKFREFGVSVHDKADFLDEMLTEHPEICFVILQINFVDWDSDVIQARQNYEVAVKHGVPVVVMEGCKGGTLAALPDEAVRLMKDYNPDASLASWAYRFCGSLPGVRVVLAGCPTNEMLHDNMKTFENFVPLNEEEYEILGKVTEIVNKNTAIPCTKCRYCEPKCPKKIPISEYFALYNDMKRLTDNTYYTEVIPQYCYWISMIENGATPAADCIGCRSCEKVCPQELPISSLLIDKFVAEIEHHDTPECGPPVKDQG